MNSLPPALSASPNVTLSVAMATFNGAEFLGEQLHSIARQERPVEEIVLCDDGSTDQTLEVVTQFAAEQPGLVRLYRNQSRLGYAQNFAQAIELCRGEIIFLSDQDDCWLPQKTEKIACCFGASGADLVASPATVTDRNLTKTGLTIRPELRASASLPDHAPSFFSHGCTLAFRRQLRRSLLPVSPPWCHDSWICFLASMLGKIAIVDEPLMLYRRHGASAGVNHRLDHGWLAEIAAGFSGMSRFGYEEKVEAWRVMQAHLEHIFNEGDPSCPQMSSLRREQILQGVAARREFYLERAQLTGRPRHRRLGAAFHTLLSGRYHAFATGWRSLAKDLLIV